MRGDITPEPLPGIRIIQSNYIKYGVGRKNYLTMWCDARKQLTIFRNGQEIRENDPDGLNNPTAHDSLSEPMIKWGLINVEKGWNSDTPHVSTGSDDAFVPDRCCNVA